MKRNFPLLGCLALALTSLTFASAASAAPAKPKRITCPFLEAGKVSFDVPAKFGGLPKDVDFDYDSKATHFSFRDGNLSFVAMDEGHPTRLRVVISAQRNKKSGAYEGQIFVDMGGNQQMIHNGPVRCTVDAG